jgi:excisionase family DNA binding protein
VPQYTTVQAAKILGIGRDTLYRWMKAKKIPTGRITRVGEYEFRTWTDEELDRVRAYMRRHPRVGRGRKRKKK